MTADPTSTVTVKPFHPDDKTPAQAARQFFAELDQLVHPWSREAELGAHNRVRDFFAVAPPEPTPGYDALADALMDYHPESTKLSWPLAVKLLHWSTPIAARLPNRPRCWSRLRTHLQRHCYSEAEIARHLVGLRSTPGETLEMVLLRVLRAHDQPVVFRKVEALAVLADLDVSTYAIQTAVCLLMQGERLDQDDKFRYYIKEGW